MTLLMTSLVTSKMTSKLYTESEISKDRVFEVKILDLRKRKDIKQKSFSLYVDKGVSDDNYISADDLKARLEALIKNNLNKKID